MSKMTTEIPDTDAIRRMHAQISNNQSPLYAMYVIDPGSGTVLREFGFDISPQSIRLDEAAAAEAVATQEGGYWSDDRGQYFKDLVVSGTFGFRPTPGRALDYREVLGEQSLGANEQRSALTTSTRNADPFPGEVTGFDRFRRLANLFRFYWDRKKLRSTAASTVMVWANWKKGEVSIAQPQRFGRDETAPSGRFKITYNFTLRLLAPLDVGFKPPDFLTSPANPKGKQSALQAVRDSIGRVSELNGIIDGAASQAAGVGFDPIREVSRLVGDTVASVSAFMNSLEGIVRQGEDAFLGIAQLPLQALREAHRHCLDAAAWVDSLKDPQTRLTAYFDDLGHAMKEMARKLGTVFVGMYAGTIDDVNRVARLYGDQYRRRDEAASRSSDGVVLSRTKVGDRGSGTSLGGRVIPRGVRMSKVPSGTTIKAFALSQLGSAGRWKEIAILNGLEAPYLSPSGDGVTVLRPGDPIKVPAEPEDDSDVNQVFPSRDDLVRDDDLRYGRDLKIDPVTRDFVPDARGDLDVISGVPNLRQAAMIKVFTRPGGLRLHPWFGFDPRPGEGATVDRLSRQQLRFRMTILSDTRIDRIGGLTMKVDGDVLAIHCAATTKDNDDSLPLDLAARLR